ncbi:MAG TPA: hypothetical protein VGK87_08205 [Anaerolineae bacterium]
MELLPVSMGWRLPDESRLKVTFEARFVSYEPDKDRWVVTFERNLSDLSNVDAATQALVAALTGAWAYVPADAREGITLPLKYETLTRQIRFFYDVDPRTLASAGTSSTKPR